MAYSALNNNKLDVSIASEALKDIISDNRPKPITADLIMNVVAAHFNLKVDDFKSKKRSRNIAYPRQIAMYLCRELTDLSLPKIGDEFGGRDHTTVIHACEKIASELETDIELNKVVNKLKNDIREN